MSKPQDHSQPADNDLDSQDIASTPPQSSADFTQTTAFLHPKDPNKLSTAEYMLYHNMLALHDRLGRFETALLRFIAADHESQTREATKGVSQDDSVIKSEASGCFFNNEHEQVCAEEVEAAFRTLQDTYCTTDMPRLEMWDPESVEKAHNSTTNGDIDGIVNRSSHSEENAVAAPSVELIWRSDDGKLVLSRMRYRDDIPVQRN